VVRTLYPHEKLDEGVGIWSEYVATNGYSYEDISATKRMEQNEKNEPIKPAHSMAFTLNSL
jgi:hypothetical protein